MRQSADELVREAVLMGPITDEEREQAEELRHSRRHHRMVREIRYWLLGHPSWPGNLSTADEQEALDWFDKYRHEHPVYVDRVVQERSRTVSSSGRVRAEKTGA